jgi:hypothetical protein
MLEMVETDADRMLDGGHGFEGIFGGFFDVV